MVNNPNMRLSATLTRLARAAAPMRGRADQAAARLVGKLTQGEWTPDEEPARLLEDLFTGLEYRVQELEQQTRRPRFF